MILSCFISFVRIISNVKASKINSIPKVKKRILPSSLLEADSLSEIIATIIMTALNPAFEEFAPEIIEINPIAISANNSSNIYDHLSPTSYLFKCSIIFLFSIIFKLSK